MLEFVIAERMVERKARESASVMGAIVTSVGWLMVLLTMDWRCFRGFCATSCILRLLLAPLLSLFSSCRCDRNVLSSAMRSEYEQSAEGTPATDSGRQDSAQPARGSQREAGDYDCCRSWEMKTMKRCAKVRQVMKFQYPSASKAARLMQLHAGRRAREWLGPTGEAGRNSRPRRHHVAG